MRKEVKLWNRLGKQFKSVYASNPGYDPETASLHTYLEWEQLKRILKKIKKNIVKNSLDVGAGTGRFSIFLSKLSEKVIAIEPAGSMYKILRDVTKDIKNIKTYKKDIQSFRTRMRFDLILVSSVFTYFNDSEVTKTLEKLKKIINHDGIIIVRDFFIDNDIKKDYERLRKKETWEKIVSSAGFKITISIPTRCPLFLFNVSKKIKIPIHKLFYTKLKKIYRLCNLFSIFFNFIYFLLNKPRMYFFILKPK